MTSRFIIKWSFITALGYELYQISVKLFNEYISENNRFSAAILFSKDSIFLAKNSDARQSLADLLSKYQQQNSFIIFGDGDKSVDCEKISFKTDTIFIYGNIKYTINGDQNSNDEIDLCYQYKTVSNNLEMLLKAVKTTLLQKLLGDYHLHFEIFGSHSSLAINHTKPLPLWSTVSTHSSSNYIALNGITDELLIKQLAHYIPNPYLRFIKNILINADNSAFSINISTGVKSFTVVLPDDICTNQSIKNWQNEQIVRFSNFYKEISTLSQDYGQNHFIDVFNITEIKDWYEKLQIDHIERFKQILLFTSVVKNKVKTVECLLRGGVDVDSELLNGTTPLITAVSLGNEILVELFIDYDADLRKAKGSGINSLMAAVNAGNLNIIKILIKGSDINAQDNNLCTALIYASLAGNIEIVTILIAAGADPNIGNIYGYTPLYYAAKNVDFPGIKLLLEKGAKTTEVITDMINSNPALVDMFCAYHYLVETPDLKCNCDAEEDYMAYKWVMLGECVDAI